MIILLLFSFDFLCKTLVFPVLPMIGYPDINVICISFLKENLFFVWFLKNLTVFPTWMNGWHNMYVRAATRRKIGKTAGLPGFCGIGHGGRYQCTGMPWSGRHYGGLACQKSTLAALYVTCISFLEEIRYIWESPIIFFSFYCWKERMLFVWQLFEPWGTFKSLENLLSSRRTVLKVSYFQNECMKSSFLQK